ncbi:hypothetical protein [Treponema zioleckii]|uniref:hypothetical protein n=1 Tax=Treponema zioleckii TaxID=331680 RepID=UPI00168B97F9|nr:hypothetical protein [Treponema zioleckii]
MVHPLLIKKFESESQMMKDYLQNKTSSDYIEFETEEPVNFYRICVTHLRYNIYIKSDDPSDLEAMIGDFCLGILVDHYFIYVDTKTFQNQISDLYVYGLGLVYKPSLSCFYCILQTGFFCYNTKNKNTRYKDVGELILDWKWGNKEQTIVKYTFDSLKFYDFNLLSIN